MANQNNNDRDQNDNDQNNDDPDTNPIPNRLSKGDKDNIIECTREEALALVGLYVHSFQKLRIAVGNKISAHHRRVDCLAKFDTVQLAEKNLRQLEKWIEKHLKVYAKSQPLGLWAMSNLGIGHIYASGLLAHIDLRHKRPDGSCISAGSIWRFAGLDPTVEWKKNERRGWNADLKRLCFLIGESFMRQHNHPDCFYGKLYAQRKLELVERNDNGGFRQFAEERLAKADRGNWRISDLQREVWGSGKVQDIGLELMAREYAVKIFLSHYHHVGFEMLYGKAPEPWIIKHGGHAHYIMPPNWPMEQDVKKRRKSA